VLEVLSGTPGSAAQGITHNGTFTKYARNPSHIIDKRRINTLTVTEDTRELGTYELQHSADVLQEEQLLHHRADSDTIPSWLVRPFGRTSWQGTWIDGASPKQRTLRLLPSENVYY
jgi:hypothetical protein